MGLENFFKKAQPPESKETDPEDEKLRKIVRPGIILPAVAAGALIASGAELLH